MSITIDGESIEIIDAHTHMGGRPRRERFEISARDSTTGRAFFNSFSGEQVVNAMDEAGVDTVIGFPMGGFSSEYDYQRSERSDRQTSMQKHPGRIFGFCRINPNVGRKIRLRVDRQLYQGAGNAGNQITPGDRPFYARRTDSRHRSSIRLEIAAFPLFFTAAIRPILTL